MFEEFCPPEDAPEVETNTLPESALQPQSTLSVASIVQKCSKITAFFNRSTKAATALSKKLKAENILFTSLSQDVETRWNFTLLLIDKVHKAYDCITTVLCRLPHSVQLLTPEELSALPEIIACLQFFATTTSNLSAETYPSISLIIPYTEILYSDLNDKKKKFATETGKSFADTLLRFIGTKLWQYEQRLYPR